MEDFKTWGSYCTIDFGEGKKRFLLPVGIISSIKDLGLTEVNPCELQAKQRNVGRIMALKNWEGKNGVSFVQLQSRSVLVKSWAHHPDQCLTEVKGMHI